MAKNNSDMKFTVGAAVLLGALNQVKGAVERRNAIAILSNVLLIAKGDELRLRATDLDIQIDTKIDAAVDAPGSVSVSSEILRQIVSKLPKAAEVVVSLSDGTLSVAAGRSRFKLQTLPASDFPDLKADEAKWNFALAHDDFAGMLRRVQFAISNEETRYYLNGVHMHIEGGKTPKLRAVTTDGHRLAYCERDVPEGAAEMTPIIIPRKTVSEALSLAEGHDSVKITLSQSKIVFTMGNVVLASKLIDGTFPDYKRVLPAGNDKTATVDLDDLVSAVDRVSTISSERGRAAKFQFQNGKLVISVSSPDSGAAEEEIEIQYGQEPIDIGFNSRYLCDLLRAVDGDAVEISLADPGSPTSFRGVKDPSAYFVLMPMRV